MVITYRDEIGVVVEELDEFGTDFCDGVVYFNDKKIEVSAVISIKEV